MMVRAESLDERQGFAHKSRRAKAKRVEPKARCDVKESASMAPPVKREGR